MPNEFRCGTPATLSIGITSGTGTQEERTRIREAAAHWGDIGGGEFRSTLVSHADPLLQVSRVQPGVQPKSATRSCALDV